MRKLARLFGLIAAALTLGAASIAGAASLTATLDRNIVPVGETVTLTLTFEGAAPPGPPNLPPIANLRPGRVSPSYNLVNGQLVSATYSYPFQAARTGDVQIAAMTVQVGGERLTTQPLSLKIVEASNAPNLATNFAFLRLIVPNTNVYVGEAFPLEMHLYYRSVEGIQMPQLKAEGFSIGQSAEPVQTQTQIGGAIFNLIIFKTSATAARAGNLNLGPVECNLTLVIPPQRRDPFTDPFSMLFGGQRRPTTLQSESVMMQVSALPSENVPATFNGAIGAFSMNVTAAPTRLSVGDPITVKVSIAGRGRLDALTLPQQTHWRDFNVYPPSRKIESTDGLGLSGAVNFEQVVIPQNHEISSLPQYEFSYFDSAQKQYRTLKGPTIPLTVSNAAFVAVPPPVPTNAAAATPPQADDILHIRPQFAAGSAGALLIQRPWFLGLQALPVVTWLVLLIARKRRESLANNPRLRRQREVAQRVRTGVKELHLLAASQDSDAFFATLFRLLQEQIGERLDVPASSITEAIVDERLHGSNLPPQTVSQLHDLFQMCNQARYAPQKTSQELSALIPGAEAVLRDLQKLRA